MEAPKRTATTYVAQFNFEAYQPPMLFFKWISFDPTSTYCSILCEAHRKSCLAKKEYVRPLLTDSLEVITLVSIILEGGTFFIATVAISSPAKREARSC